MELSLHGSQISLATRYKPSTPTISYPVFVQRPGSANVVTINKFPAKPNVNTNSRRPVSADSKFFRGCGKGSNGLTSPCCCCNEPFRCTNTRKKKRPVTSSNIFKLLLSEPIKRSWVSADTVFQKELICAKNEPKLTVMQKSHAGSDGVTDGSSIEDEIPEVCSSDEDFEKDWCKTSKPTVQLKPGIVTKPPVGSSLNNVKTKSNHSKFNPPKSAGLRFAKSSKPSELSTEIEDVTGSPKPLKAFTKEISRTDKQNSDTVDASNTALELINPAKSDLPGRVSFSKNDVYEIDYSDIENDTDTSHSLEQGEQFRKKNVRFEDEFFKKACRDDDLDAATHNDLPFDNYRSSNEVPVHAEEKCVEDKLSIVNHNEIPPPEKYCCSLKCNSLMCKTVENRHPASETNLIDHSEKIIQEYKREIENINRRHELELKWSGNTSCDIPDPLPEYFSRKRSPASKSMDAFSKHTNEQNEKRPNGPVKKNPNFLEIESRQLTNHSWNVANREMESRPSISSGKTESEDSVTRGSSSTVIDNYLKATNQKTPPKVTTNTAKQKVIKKPPQTVNPGRKIKSAQSTNIHPTLSRLSKAKSVGCLRNSDSKLNEFHIDKVESWMSTHEDTFSDTGIVHYRNNRLGSTGNLSYKKTWRETPTSKTDDEGNFSLDDQIDTNSYEDSTYGDIGTVAKQIEHTNKMARSTLAEEPLQIDNLSISQSQNRRLITVPEPMPGPSAVSNDKVKEILQYLDEVDYSCEKTINNIQLQNMPDSFRSDLEYSIEPDIVGDMPKMADLLKLPNQQLARRIIGLSLRANELSNAIQLSKEHMDKVRGDKAKGIRLEKQTAQTRLKEQKSHYESIVTRHQGFIEQLLKDKASLCEKVAALTRRIESQTQTSEHKLQTEIARVKETALAGEKIRRERWVRENTKKIKELTVKGLEQEINKMTCNHQKEISELKRQHQQAILDAVEEARQKHESIEMGIRETYAQDREVAIEKERNAIRERFERQIEIEQRSFEEHKSRLVAEFSAEKDRMCNEVRQREQEFEKRREKLLQDKKDIIEHLNREFADKTRMMEKRNQSELASIREQFESDFAIWKREQETMYKLREVETANSIRQQCRMERDKQIDSIVAKVDAEALKTQQDYEGKLSRLKSQYDNELRDMERAQMISRDKYAETRTKLAECEGTIQNFHATVKQLELQLSHSKKICDDLTTEKEGFKENARKEIQQEIELLRKDRDDEIQQIHKRVQTAIGKKDNSMDVLQKENNSLRDRCLKLEAIIRQQRKDYCTK